MGKIIIVRHGETKYNVERRFTGQRDIPLNKAGERQAMKLAEMLKETKIDMIYSSPLKRAYKTAEFVNRYHNLPIILSEGLKEIYMGEYEGLNIDEFKSHYRDFQALLQVYDRESEESVIKRVYGVINEIIKNHRDKTIFIVAHGYISKIFYKYFNDPTDDEFRRYKVRNCELIEYDF